MPQLQVHMYMFMSASYMNPPRLYGMLSKARHVGAERSVVQNSRDQRTWLQSLSGQ
jgi:hypothetical protein